MLQRRRSVGLVLALGAMIPSGCLQRGQALVTAGANNCSESKSVVVLGSQSTPTSGAGEQSGPRSSGGFLELRLRGIDPVTLESKELPPDESLIRCSVHLEFFDDSLAKAKLYTAKHCLSPILVKEATLLLENGEGTYAPFRITLSEVETARNALQDAGTQLPAGTLRKDFLASFGELTRMESKVQLSDLCRSLVPTDLPQSLGRQNICATFHDLIAYEFSFASELSAAESEFLKAQRAFSQELKKSLAPTDVTQKNRLEKLKPEYDRFFEEQRLNGFYAFSAKYFDYYVSCPDWLANPQTSSIQGEDAVMMQELCPNYEPLNSLVMKYFPSKAGDTPLTRIMGLSHYLSATWFGPLQDFWLRLEDMQSGELTEKFHLHGNFSRVTKGTAFNARATSGMELPARYLLDSSVLLGGFGAPANAREVALTNGGVILFSKDTTSSQIYIQPGDSGMLLSIGPQPAAVVAMVNDEPTSGGAVLRPLPVRPVTAAQPSSQDGGKNAATSDKAGSGTTTTQSSSPRDGKSQTASRCLL